MESRERWAGEGGMKGPDKGCGADLGGLCRKARTLAQREAGPGTDPRGGPSSGLDSGSEAGTGESLAVARAVLGEQGRTLVEECDMGTGQIEGD